MQVSAKSIITEVLSVVEASGHPAVRVSLLIDACAIFGFSANTVRVTLVKMRADRAVASPERGAYQLGKTSLELSHRVMGWRAVAERMVDWDGSWVGVYTGHLTRSDRSALRRRTRALRLVGFRELEEGLYVRPNNLRGGVPEVRELLERLGVQRTAIATRLEDLSEIDSARARDLWDCGSIVAGYTVLREELQDSTARRTELPLEEAVREAFLLGREVIRWVTLDPLLPEQMVPIAERDALVEAMIRYDEIGQALWRRYLGVEESEEAA
ncbi:MAG: PaaX family transcriptional regulator [Deltaproteobacteria bacterium]|nr:PaaX family transcriptional regulator [Deltaproteobacteria bacterium]MBW2629404.1 PaaX family transcriptional regulator [Deltaproteobacteria bacterium]